MLQPSLLDRLRDDDPATRVEAPRTRAGERGTERGSERGNERADFRETVLRDLGWLLNTTQLTDREALAFPGSHHHEGAHLRTNEDEEQRMRAFPYAQHSVLKYGIPTLAGQTESSTRRQWLQDQVRQAIVNFEPRLVSDDLQVELIEASESEASGRRISLRIVGRLGSKKKSTGIVLRTDVDLESGRADVRELLR